MLPSDPEFRKDRDERLAAARLAFAASAMSVDVFRATLYSLGLRGRDIESEVRLHRPFQTIGEAAARQLERRKWA